MTNALGSSVPAQEPAVFRELLDGVFCSARTGAIKPEPEAFAAVEHASELRPEELLHVGDSLTADVRGATAVGWHTAWVDRHHTTGPLASAASTLRLHSLNTLPLLLPARQRRRSHRRCPADGAVLHVPPGQSPFTRCRTAFGARTTAAPERRSEIPKRQEAPRVHRHPERTRSRP
ncbi:HAD family hydrolase [Streptomyces sp. NPDC002476]|uniref:HAD family hydrolase n=1 Tax=Streptomyces sp. NPDC002476 TaxID=3364648 RepID=UPI0036AA3C37